MSSEVSGATQEQSPWLRVGSRRAGRLGSRRPGSMLGQPSLVMLATEAAAASEGLVKGKSASVAGVSANTARDKESAEDGSWQKLAAMSAAVPQSAVRGLGHLSWLAQAWVNLGKKQREGSSRGSPQPKNSPPLRSADSASAGEGPIDKALEARIAEVWRSYENSASLFYNHVQQRASSSLPQLDTSWLPQVPQATMDALAALPKTFGGSAPARAVTDATGRAVTGASQATLGAMAQLERLREGLGALLDKEVRLVVRAVEHELLALQRQGHEERADPAVCMVLDGKGEARVLRLGDSVPELLYPDADVQGEALFEAPMMVSIDADEDGNVFLCSPRLHRGTPLPLASDVLWLRQMASYSVPPSPHPDNAHGPNKSWDEEAAPVTVAAVTLPVSERGDLLVTQRAFRGMYDGMWVFPGGHVDGGEGLAAAAMREVVEETGVEVLPGTLRPLAVWEGTVSSKQRQFCVVFFAGDVSAGAEDPAQLQLQAHEVHRAAWVPRELLPRLLDTHTLHTADVVPSFSPGDDGGRRPAPPLSLAEIQAGLGEGHKFALKTYLEALNSADGKVPMKSARAE